MSSLNICGFCGKRKQYDALTGYLACTSPLCTVGAQVPPPYPVTMPSAQAAAPVWRCASCGTPEPHWEDDDDDPSPCVCGGKTFTLTLCAQPVERGWWGHAPTARPTPPGYQLHPDLVEGCGVASCRACYQLISTGRLPPEKDANDDGA